MNKIKALTGNGAASEAMKQINPDVVAAYPITPSTQIMEDFAKYHADGEVDAELIRVESEHSAMSACVGASLSGARVMTATSSAGLCLGPDSDIILNNPGIAKIKDFVDNQLEANTKIKYGNWDIANSKGKVLSWNGNNFEYDTITNVQRVKAPKRLLKIVTKSGSEVEFTPDHKILVNSKGNIVWKEAKNIKENECLYAPRLIEIKKPLDLYVLDLLTDTILVKLDSKFIKCIKQNLAKRYGSISKGIKELEIPEHQITNRTIAISSLKKLSKNKIIKWSELKGGIDTFSRQGGIVKNTFFKINEDLMYLLGLLSSDGHIRKREKSKHEFVFTNKNKILLQKFQKLYKVLFSNGRLSNTSLKSGARQLQGSSFIFATLAKSLPLEKIFILKTDLISAFLKGYFDGDGSCQIRDRNRFTIFIHCKDKRKVYLLRKLLQRLSIISHLFIKNNNLHGMYICGSDNTLKFIKLVGSYHPKKHKRFKIAEKFLLKIKGKPSKDDKFFLDPVKKIEKIRNKYDYVYDITVKKNHCFVPNGAFVVSNCFMWEILGVASGLRTPVVMNVVNRALSAPINIHCDHSDSMGARDLGWIQIYSENAQEVYINNLLAIKLAESCKLPVMIMQDGFITSHCVVGVKTLEDRQVKQFIGQYKPKYSLLKDNITIGNLALPDYYFEIKMQNISAMEEAKKLFLKIDSDLNKLIKHNTGYSEEYKIRDAKVIIVAINSTCGTIKDVVDRLRKKGKKVGLLKIRLFRPFPYEEVKRILKNKRIVVMDRSVSFGSYSPLFSEIKNSLDKEDIYSVIYGLGGKNIYEDDIEDIFNKALQNKLKKVGYVGVRE